MLVFVVVCGGGNAIDTNTKNHKTEEKQPNRNAFTGKQTTVACTPNAIPHELRGETVLVDSTDTEFNNKNASFKSKAFGGVNNQKTRDCKQNEFGCTLQRHSHE